MARLKIGDGIQFEAHLPNIEQSEPNVEPSETNLLAYIHDTMKQKEVDLSSFATKQEMASSVITLCGQRDELERKVEGLNLALLKQMEDLRNIADEVQNKKIELPEVKHITHVKDVSLEAIKECDKMIKYSEIALMLKISDLQKKNRTQKIINFVLGCTVLLTIFLHLK